MLMMLPIGPAGTTQVILVSFTTEKLVAFTPLNLTAVAPVKFEPVIATVVPVAPFIGVKAVMIGADNISVNISDGVYGQAPSEL